jgi:5-methylcytosine-specific restriction endonuclease McrA
MKKQDEIKLQRLREKRKFYKRFVFKIIEDHYRKKLYAQFNYSCFNCGETEEFDLSKNKPWTLCLDHHIPMIHGGHFRLGNLVVLCRKCNSMKHDNMPEEFYDKEKLDTIELILEEQKNLEFDFVFDWKLWQEDRVTYLSSLGIDRSLIDIALTNELHPYFIAPYCEEHNYIIQIIVDN